MLEKDEIIFYYFMDPMCSWCWAFNPTIKKIKSFLPPHVQFEIIMGGLAADTDQPMPLDLQNKIQSIWQEIEYRVPGTQFNYDFWKKNTPYRSTYLACRAVLVAASFSIEKRNEMIDQIQTGYYLEAKNPSLKEVLTDFAINIGIQKEEFQKLLDSDVTEKLLQNHLKIAKTFQVTVFPSLRLLCDEKIYELPLDYNNYQITLQSLAPILYKNSF